MKGKLQEYALLAEIISAICIVISLVFVGLQVRQGAEETAANTEAVRSTVRQSMMHADLQLLTNMQSNAIALNSDNAQRFVSSLEIHASLRARSSFWIEYKNGFIDDETLNSYFIPLLAVLSRSEQGKNVWQNVVSLSENDLSYPHDFVEEVSRRLLIYQGQSTQGLKDL